MLLDRAILVPTGHGFVRHLKGQQGWLEFPLNTHGVIQNPRPWGREAA